MYYQSYEEYMRDVLGYPRETSMPTYNGYSGIEQRNVNMEINDDEIECLYPEIYRKVYPMVCKACMQYRGEITEDLVTRLTNEVYANLEIEEVRGEENNSNKEVRNNQSAKSVSSSKLDTLKHSNETRQKRPNNTLKDLIRILIIRELLRRRRRPGRPPFPGGPRPPMPRNQSSYNMNSFGMQGYY